MSADPSGAAALLAQPAQAMQAGYGASMGASSQFSDAIQAAQNGVSSGGSSGSATSLAGATPTGGVDALQPALKGVMDQLQSVNGEASSLAQEAQAAKAKGPNMSPGDMVMLSVRCQEFMFHCQLTSNIANRTSDGLQQLFRQQG